MSTNTENDGVAVVPQPGALATMAANYGVEPRRLLETLKETIAPKATTAQLQAFCIVANEYGLNPFTREIYAFPGTGGGIVPLVGIDGWLKLINGHAQFDGMEVEMADDGSACTVTIHRKDMRYPTVITEYLAECKRNTPPWNAAPRRMLRHKAIIQAARVAFGFSGIYEDKEDAEAREEVIRDVRDVTPVASARSRLGVGKCEVRGTGDEVREPVGEGCGGEDDAYRWLWGAVCRQDKERWGDMLRVMAAIGFAVPEDGGHAELCRFAAAVKADAEACRALRESGFDVPMI